MPRERCTTWSRGGANASITIGPAACTPKCAEFVRQLLCKFLEYVISFGRHHGVDRSRGLLKIVTGRSQERLTKKVVWNRQHDAHTGKSEVPPSTPCLLWRNLMVPLTSMGILDKTFEVQSTLFCLQRSKEGADEAFNAHLPVIFRSS